MRDDVWIRCPRCREFVKTPGEDQISTPLFAATCPHCGLEFDWRLTHSENFLRGAVFRWEEYFAPSEVWDHDHCAFCTQKFMELDQAGIERFGYVTNSAPQEWWVCHDCFEDFRDEMGWRIDPPEDQPA